jgi:O-antigen/teichoic acid export membrane protein
MVTYALFDASVWALIVGILVGEAFHTVASHALPSGYRNRFQWSPSAAQELTVFGRWIFGSSAVSFLGAQGDRAMIGRFVGASQLGVYQIAAELGNAATGLISRLIAGVLYPAFSQLQQQESTDQAQIRTLYHKARLALDLLAQGGLGLLCGVGPWIVRFIWDSRYWGAGWMLRILCLRGAIV